MRFPVSVLVVLFILVLGGCGENKARVTGTLVENGQPKSFGSNEAALQMTMVGPDGKLDNKHSYTAVVNNDGSFEVVASGGQLPLGKYQIAIQFRGGDPKYKAFAAPDSPLRREIKAGRNELTVDLAKPNE